MVRNDESILVPENPVSELSLNPSGIAARQFINLDRSSGGYALGRGQISELLPELR
jgi:hypothetical protein